MKKMNRLFKKLPPKRQLTSLAAIVDDWVYRFGAEGPEKHRRDTVVEYCASAHSFVQAVERACNSRAANGKMHNHQSRVTQGSRNHFCNAILAMWGVGQHKAFKTFDQLHDEIERIGGVISGIGPVTIYDVATRIAAYLGLEITSLYLHAGVRQGWDILHGERTDRRIKRIPKARLPVELQRLPADECEDMLCAYREQLRPWCKPKG